jgi:hypothetical protein
MNFVYDLNFIKTLILFSNCSIDVFRFFEWLCIIEIIFEFYNFAEGC